VDRAIIELCRVESARVAFAACQDAYAGILNAREIAAHFRELRQGAQGGKGDTGAP
jgi:hypothetical protein